MRISFSKILLKSAFIAVFIVTAGMNASAQEIFLQEENLPDSPAAARSYAAVPGKETAPLFANPQFGPSKTCLGITRQAILMNPEIVSGQPVHIRFHLSCYTLEEEETFIAKLAFGADIQVYVVPPFGSPYEYLGPELGTTLPNASLQMEDFDHYRLDMEMVMDTESISGAAFDIPGTYHLRVLMRCNSPSGPLEMLDLGEFVLTVKEPEGHDRQAFEMITNPNVYRALQMRIVETAGGIPIITPEIRSTLKKIVEEYQAAAIRPYAMFVLARAIAADGERVQAVKMLRRLQNEYPNHLIYEDALMMDLKETRTLGWKQESFERFEIAWTDPVVTQIIKEGSPYHTIFVKDRLPPKPGNHWMIWEEPGPDPEYMTEFGPGRVVSTQEFLQTGP